MPSQGIALLFSTRQTSVLTRLESAACGAAVPAGAGRRCQDRCEWELKGTLAWPQSQQ